jgi:phosphoglucosamine mutase
VGRRYFGTDGVRGKVGQLPITPEFVLRLGYAAGKVLAQGQGGGKPTVIIGKDTRISGYMLEASLQSGFSAAGVDVLLSGPISTPAVAYLARALRLSAGVVLSASHNPYDDNGIKFFRGDGNKLPDETELLIEKEMDNPMGCVRSDLLGRARRMDDAQGRYIEFCKSNFPAQLDLKGMKIVVDCANGAAYHIAPHVFHELGADVVSIAVAPNGININEGVGATHPESVQRAVRMHKADIGISLDGDADRLVVVDNAGRIYNGDELLYVMVKDRLRTELVGGAVGTLMSNLALEQGLSKLGVHFARAKVGDRYVLEMLQDKGWKYGGESSGHLLALDCHTTGDGIISALQILSAMRRSDKTMGELTRDLQLFPQKLINVKVPSGFEWAKHAALQKAKIEVEAQLGAQGRVLIRPSGTEPLLRLMVEANSVDVADKCARHLAHSVA